MASIRARVELKGALTHQAPASKGGRLMKKRSPVILTDPAHIQYYRETAGFAVTMLENKAKAPQQEAPKSETGLDASGKYTEAILKKMKKPQLVAIADTLDLETSGATVVELIDGIIEAQNEASQDEADDEEADDEEADEESQEE